MFQSHYDDKKKTVSAGVLLVLLPGGTGAHWFYLGDQKKGIPYHCLGGGGWWTSSVVPGDPSLCSDRRIRDGNHRCSEYGRHREEGEQEGCPEEF